MSQRELRALQKEHKEFSPRMAGASRFRRRGRTAATAATPNQLRQQEPWFGSSTPERPPRPALARESSVVVLAQAQAAVALEQHVVGAVAEAAPVGSAQAQAAVALEQHVVGTVAEGASAGSALAQAAVALGQHVVGAESTAEDARVQSNQDSAGMAQMLQVLQQMQESQAQMRAEVQESQAEMRTEVRRVRTEVCTEVHELKQEMHELKQEVHTRTAALEKRVREMEESQSQLQAQVMGVSSSTEQCAQKAESASAHAQQLRVEQVERFAVVEQQLQKFQQEQEKLKGNEERGRVAQVERMAVVEQQLQDLQQEQEQLKGSEERWRIVEQKLGEPGVGPGERARQQRLEERLSIVEQKLEPGVGPGERERQERLEERLNIVEQKLAEPGVGPGERGRQQRLEERLNIVDQQLLDQDRRRSMVEQQWHNRHARRLEEQAKLLQELRDEQERLRDEQEKIKDNEQRIGEKNNMSGAAQSGSAGPGSLQSVLAAFDVASDARRTVRTALQQMVHAQEQNERGAEISDDCHAQRPGKTDTEAAQAGGGVGGLLPGTLPPGWEERFCSSRQRVYYYQKKTGNSTWEHPTTLQGAEEETCSGGSNELGAENSEPPTLQGAEEETCSGGRNAPFQQEQKTLHDVADALASLAAQVQRMVDEGWDGAENSEPPTKEDK